MRSIVGWRTMCGTRTEDFIGEGWENVGMNMVFVVNAGSSSLKYQLFNMDDESTVCSGLCERIGLEDGIVTHKWKGQKKTFHTELATQKDALEIVEKMMLGGETQVIDRPEDIVAVGHRMTFSLSGSNEITPEVEKEILSHLDMFPLHLPHMIACFEACKEVYPHATHVAVYDNSFHLTMPPKAYMYAIPYEFYEKYGMRRYGYHSSSFRYVIGRLEELCGRPASEMKVVACHLGAGASICAIDGGKSIDTSMGYTALAGLMMGTRAGDVDPSVLPEIARKKGLTPDELDKVIYKQSGLYGVSGVSSDERDVIEAAEHGNKRAQLALDMNRYQIKKLIGAYAAAMGGLDAVIFTGGMGEKSEGLRHDVCENMEFFGIKLDEQRNLKLNRKEGKISTDDSPTSVWIIPTNEELIIARDAYRIHNEKQHQA